MQAMLSKVIGRGVVIEVIQGRNNWPRNEACPGQGPRGVEGGIQRDGNDSGDKGSRNENCKRQRTARISDSVALHVLEDERVTYLFKKWGIRRRLGINKKAGKVMRLNMPKTATTPSTVEARSDDCC
ncbi:hypothetical protein G6O67_007311 [Ophiocordyceps sinensis]|uniref:Uncharacterized protein n=1 Tax=Ophiocordyceps sinensis TaxID=72228 RepID=A0A8H4LTG6_9HYPO|nr:hypothetical protein G6O67_007311 [Ophiocordyceps sinensis]